MSRPLDQVLAHAWGDFTPARPDRPPWWQPVSVVDEVAATGNRAVVRLERTDRAELHGLDRRPSWQDDLEHADWTRQGWTPAP